MANHDHLINQQQLIIKEKPPLRYSFAVGLLLLMPMLLLSLFGLAPYFFWVIFVLSLIFTLLLGRSFSLVISKEGIRQRCFGKTLYLIRWDEINSVTYKEGFLCPRYCIKGRHSPLTMIDLPIDDESFPIIKQALADQGIVLAQAELTKGI
ncbi:MAG: hypothetical protein AB1489_10895 [Acidobacteriota bacterium]